MSAPRTRIAVLAGLVLLLTPGCGYQLAGTSSVLPPNIVIIAVMPFENHTSRTEIDQRVTEAVARELSRRGKYEVVSDPGKADAVMEGAVTSYQTIPVEFNTEGFASRTEATVSIEATLRETRSDVVLWSQSGLIFKQQFDVVGNPSSTGLIDLESAALDALAEGAASVLASSLFEGF